MGKNTICFKKIAKILNDISMRTLDRLGRCVHNFTNIAYLVPCDHTSPRMCSGSNTLVCLTRSYEYNYEYSYEYMYPGVNFYLGLDKGAGTFWFLVLTSVLTMGT